MDFSSSPIPKCKAEAKFTLGLLIDPEDFDFELWQEDHSNFYDCVSFYWDIERNEKTAELDFSFGDNLGVECVPIIQKNISAPSNPSPSNYSYINLVNLPAKDRQLLTAFLAEHWTEEIKNIEAIKAGSGKTLTIEILEGDASMLNNVLSKNGFKKFITKE